jgi:PAS domain S-box-containing protein
MNLAVPIPTLIPPSRRPAREAAEARIREVLEHGVTGNALLAMVMQPVVDLRSGRVIGAEALARFKSEPYRTPDVWFDEARRCGLGTRLELLAIEIALSMLDGIPAHAFVGLNASPETMVSPELRAVLGRVSGERVVLELTEHARVDDYDAVHAAVSYFRARGVRLAVDDAGAGFASFQHILRLQPDIIKLDRSLTNGVDSNPVRHALASSMVTFAASLGAKICAEGIETATEIVALQQLGVACGQGYYLGKPAPLPLVSPPAGLWYGSAQEAEPAEPSSTVAPVLRSPARLAALQATELLDTGTEEAFDRFTRLAARLLGAPIALLSFLDDRRQFFKSAVGAGDIRETPLSHAICANTVIAKAPLIIEDARIHPLVRDNPAIPAFGVAAYAGVPIVTLDDQAIGTLCVIDRQPHAWTDSDVQTLRELGRMVATHIELRKTHKGLHRRAAIADAILQVSRFPIIVFDVESRIECTSASACALLGRTEQELRGLRAIDLLHPDDHFHMIELREQLLKGETHRIEAELRYPSPNGDYPRRHVSGTLVRDSQSAAQFFVVTLGDVVESR